MEISQIKKNIQTSNLTSTTNFSIGNENFILGILREKLYSNPLRVIVQEYASNARDAHREIKKYDIPIQIKVPSSLNPNLEIQDFGPGISPSRMNDIFIRYGNSTKRDSNELTGGFGIGAKCAWSYTDQFTITTIVDGIKYCYSAYLDEESNGKLALLHQEETTEENGTLISIPILFKDFQAINDNIIFVTKYWDVRPKLVGNNIPSYPKIEYKINKENWFIPINDNNSRYHYSSYAIIDGIPYELSLDYKQKELLNLSNEEYHWFTTGTNFKFKTGDITLSANREQIYYDDKTRKKLKEIITSIISSFENEVQSKISEGKDLIEANKIYYDLIGNTQFKDLISKKEFIWEGIKIPYKVSLLFEKELETTKNKIVSLVGSNIRVYRQSPLKIDRQSSISIYSYINRQIDHSYIVIDDENKKHIKKAKLATIFESDKNIKSITIFSIKKKELNLKTKEIKFSYTGKEIDDWFKESNIDKINPFYLSKIKETKNSNLLQKNNLNLKPVKINAFNTYKLRTDSNGNLIKNYIRSGIRIFTLEQSIVDLENQEGYYFEYNADEILNFGNYADSVKNSFDFFVTIKGVLNIDLIKTPIYGFKSSTIQRAKESKLKDLYIELKKKVTKILRRKTFQKQYELYIKYINSIANYENRNTYREKVLIKELMDNLIRFKNQKSELYLALSSLKEIFNSFNKELNLCKQINYLIRNIPELSKNADKFKNIESKNLPIISFDRYPMMKYLRDSYTNINSITEVINYINLVDEKGHETND